MQAWVAEMKRRMGYVDEPDETPLRVSKRLMPAAAEDEPKTEKKPRKPWTLQYRPERQGQPESQV